MRAIFLGAAALTTLTSAALGADLPARQVVPAYAPPPFTWTGFYVGANAGAVFDSNSTYAISGNGTGQAAAVATGAVRPLFATKANSFIAGAQFGYNLMLGNTIAGGAGLGFGGTPGGILVGFEADVDGLADSGSGSFAGGAFNTFYHARTDVLGTARGRIGYAFGNVLVYGTGGLAYGDVHDRVAVSGPTAALTANGNLSGRLETGFAYGGGVEYAIPTDSFVNLFKASAVTVKAEFIRYELSSTSIFLTNATTGNYGVHLHTGGDVARLGVNYRFSQPVAPVVARY